MRWYLWPVLLLLATLSLIGYKGINMDGEKQLVAFLKQFVKERKNRTTLVVRGKQLALDINYVLGAYKDATTNK